jgi:leader peptidase (prepilin peptidase) / N-methyltransferase
VGVVWVGVAAVGGLIAGAFARALAAGFGADPDDPRKEARAAFAAAVRQMPVPRSPYRIELATAAVVAALTWRFAGVGAEDAVGSGGAGAALLLAAWLYGGVAGVALTVIDWRSRRLPDVITLGSYPIVLALLVPAGRLGQAAICALAAGGAYAVLWFIRPADLGLGDVKLAGLIGLLTGAVSGEAAFLAAIGGFFLGALYAVGLLITKRASRRSEFPFGPFMLAAALLAALVYGP